MGQSGAVLVLAHRLWLEIVLYCGNWYYIV